MNTVKQVQILDEAVCIAHKPNTLKKGKSNYFPSSYEQRVIHTEFFISDTATW